MAAEPGPRYETNIPFPILLQTTDLIQLPHQWAPVRTSESTKSGEEETNEDNGRPEEGANWRPRLGCCPIAQAMNPSEAMGGPWSTAMHGVGDIQLSSRGG
jgi:hypothetical protein